MPGRGNGKALGLEISLVLSRNLQKGHWTGAERGRGQEWKRLAEWDPKVRS